MRWTEQQIKHIVADLAEENPFACRALFKVSHIVFTDRVPTLAVSLSGTPILMINRGFLDQHGQTENDVKALLLHEFLHVILLHTEKFESNSPLLNLALDAVINAIIHRIYGEKYSDFFRKFYKGQGYECLLRPAPEKNHCPPDLYSVHTNLYLGRFAADDLHELLDYFLKRARIQALNIPFFLGNHEVKKEPKSAENEKLLKDILGKMDGLKIWNRPGLRGGGDRLNHEQQTIDRFREHQWKSVTYQLLRKCLIPDWRAKPTYGLSTQGIPVMSTSDRRAMSVLPWSGMIPLAKNSLTTKQKSESAHIYLDVSGSMDREIRPIVSLLSYFRPYIHLPLWVFSNQVEAARFAKGKLIYRSTMGTSIACVFDHIRKNNFRKCLLITDGYVEEIDKRMLRGISTEHLRVILSADGNGYQFSKHGIHCVQLKRLRT